MWKRIIVAIAALFAVILAAPTAYAETTVVKDGADAPASPNDILKMKVNHKPRTLVVRTSHTDLRKVRDGGTPSTLIFIDVNKNRKGPELALAAALESGTDYALVRVKNWKASDKRIDCRHSFDINWKKNVTRLKLDRGCFGKRARARVSQRMVDHFDPSHPVRDWAPGKRKFSAWVKAS